jgi:hypothetical protein
MTGLPAATQVGPTRRFWIKTVVFLLIFCLLCLLLPQGYKVIRKWRYLNVAETAFHDKKYDLALYFAFRVHQEDINNKKAASLISQTYLLLEAEQALTWLVYAAKLDPENPETQITCGKVALVKGQRDLARKCLQQAQKTGKASAEELLELEFFILLLEGKKEEAIRLVSSQSEGRQKTRLDLHRAILLLKDNTGKAEEGIQLLWQMAEQDSLGLPALEQLIRYGLQQKDHALLARASSALGLKKDLSLQHYFLVLQAQRSLNQPLPQNFEQEVWQKIQGQEKNLAYTLQWLLKNGQENIADRIITQCRERSEHLSVVQAFYLTRLEDKADWETILKSLTDSTWKDLGAMRYLYLLQAIRVLDTVENRGLEKSYYSGLELELRRNPSSIFATDRAATRWGWGKDRIRLWEAFDHANEWPESLLKNSLDQAQKKGDTIQLYGLGRLALKKHPDNTIIKNNVITMALLLDLNLPQHLLDAEKNYQNFPQAKALQTTYALALLKNGKTQEAVSQFDSYSTQDLQIPAIAAYYAKALLANGQKEKATPYIALAEKARLLPEEKALLQP